MNKLSVSLIMVLGVLSCFGQMKTVETSVRKPPQWHNSSQAEYIITSAIASDVESARQQCLDNVRKYVIQSVAENVVMSTKSEVSQQTMNAQVVSFLDEFKSTYETRSADMPFLKGISASRIEDSYWEKQQDKATKKVQYIYSIKYPFPSLELKSMIHEFDKRDKEMVARYAALEQGIRNITSVEQIDKAIVDLNPLIAYFFDDSRKNAASNLQNSYRKLYDNITFVPVSTGEGEHIFALELSGRRIGSSQRIALKSECATELSATQKDGIVNVVFNGKYCDRPAESWITATFKFGGKSVPYKFFYDASKGTVKVSPQKTLYLTAATVNKKEVGQIAVRMELNSEHAGPYVIKSLSLDVPGLAMPLLFNDLDQSFDSRQATLEALWPGSIGLEAGQKSLQNFLRGTMLVEVTQEGISKRVDFALPFKANW